MVKLEINYEAEVQSGKVVYNKNDYSFETIGINHVGITSALFNDVSLELDDSGKVIYIWGLCPHLGWTAGRLEPPDAMEGELRLVLEAPLEEGVAIGLTSSGKRLPTIVDRENGWVMIGTTSTTGYAVSIMDGLMAQITEKGELAALWIRPENGID
jgi:hypothetical protein